MSGARSRVMRLAAAGSIACIAVAALVVVLSGGHTPRAALAADVEQRRLGTWGAAGACA
jgi:hypothetical protein